MTQNTRISTPDIVGYELRDKIALIAINNPPINAISAAMRNGLINRLKQAKFDSAGAVLIYCKGRTFIAGADISEFDKPQPPPTLPDVISEIENLSIPVIVAMHGNTLGGGLEIAIAAHYRCALPETKFGLPEVNLGLVPGSGGTQRLPRLVGAEKALAMISSGKPIAAEDALNSGLIDVILNEPLLDSALEYTKQLLDNDTKPRLTSTLKVKSVTGDLFEKHRAKLAAKPTGTLAPSYIVDLVELATTATLKDGLLIERDRFLECRNSSSSSALRHIFFAERSCVKIPDISTDIAERTVKNVAIIGAGTMGGGISMCFASAGYPVKLVETTQENVDRGIELIKTNYARSTKRGVLSASQADAAMALITGTINYSDLADVDLVIEAAFENMAVKQSIFSKLDAVCKPSCILTTNTSYLDVDTIAAVTSRPQDVVGAHFFSPANIMKLLEVVRASKTAPDTIKTLMGIAKRIGKVPVAVGVCHGFVGNRMLKSYARQAQLLILEGSTPAGVDAAIQSWGMAMGPLAVADLAGLDISYRSRRDQGITSGSLPEFALPDLLVEQERLGQKTGAGFYQYQAKTLARQNDDEVVNIAQELASKWNVTQRQISNDEIIDRLTLSLVNEGAHILEENIATRPSDIDVVYVNGYGFPRWRGGPMYYADKLGLRSVIEKLTELNTITGDNCWVPAPLLLKLVKEDKTLASLNK